MGSSPKERTMKATMIRKAASAKDWLDRVADIKHVFGRQPEVVEVKIEKSITLPKDEFQRFADNLLDDSDIVKENLDLMRVDENKVWHCIKVTAKGLPYSILVESEGYDYARYTAIVVN